MQKHTQAQDARQMFMENFFLNTFTEISAKIGESDLSETKKTSVTLFSTPDRSGRLKNPHFYNLKHEQKNQSERLNLRISKLKTRPKCPITLARVLNKATNQLQNKVNADHLSKDKFDAHVNGLNIEAKRRHSEPENIPIGYLTNKETTNTTICSDVDERYRFNEENLKQSVLLNQVLIDSIDQNGISSKFPIEIQNVIALNEQNEFKRDTAAVYHNRLVDFIKQNQFIAPVSTNKPKMTPNPKYPETPYNPICQQNLKSKSFHIFNENKVLDYQLNLTYKVSRLLGKGSFAEVRLATRISDNVLVAIKSYPNNAQNSAQAHKVIQNEIKVLKSIDHPNIIKLLDIIVSKDYTHLVLDYCEGLNLYEYMHNRQGKAISESLARRIFIQLIDAVNYMHLNNIYHRDLKLDNIMIDRTGKVTIIDFGFAIQVPKDTKVTSFCGTPFYMAPEIYQMISYKGHSVDIWALAVILYKITVGEFPFKKSETDSTPKTSIIEVRYSLPNGLSKGLVEIFEKVFVKNPESRISMPELMQLSWLYCDA